jgi:hypothetical protein
MDGRKVRKQVHEGEFVNRRIERPAGIFKEVLDEDTSEMFSTSVEESSISEVSYANERGLTDRIHCGGSSPKVHLRCIDRKTS